MELICTCSVFVFSAVIRTASKVVIFDSRASYSTSSAERTHSVSLTYPKQLKTTYMLSR